jgi:hypothetical protein
VQNALKGFVCSPDYPNGKWNMASCEAFDNAGLYFAMAVLVNDGELP